MISIEKVSKAFNQRGQVLNELTLQVNERDTVSIMGPSGSGKTTLLNIIGSLDKPDSGKVSFMGMNIGGFDEDASALYRNRNIGFVFQDHMLLPHLTVAENIYLPLLAANLSAREKQEKKDHINEIIDRTGISGLVDKHPFQISGGEAQRVALVRALANKPSVLLADEPTGSLDAVNAEIMGELLVELNRLLGITIILATHSASLSGKMNRQLKFESGKLV